MPDQLLEKKPTPPVVLELVDRANPRSAKARRALEEQLKLSWYYGGLSILYRETKKGLAVVASGPDKVVRQAFDQLPKAKRATVTVAFPEHFELHVANICANPAPVHNGSHRA
jgi:hypothetical protein